MNKLTNEIPSSIGNLKLLNHISLGDKSFVGIIPQSLSDVTNLLALDLSSNNAMAQYLEILLSFISISFNLSHNAFTSSIHMKIVSLINLKELDLSNNRLSGQLPRTLSICIVLEHIQLKTILLKKRYLVCLLI